MHASYRAWSNFISPGLRGEALGEPFFVERFQAPPRRDNARPVGPRSPEREHRVSVISGTRSRRGPPSRIPEPPPRRKNREIDREPVGEPHARLYSSFIAHDELALVEPLSMQLGARVISISFSRRVFRVELHIRSQSCRPRIRVKYPHSPRRNDVRLRDYRELDALRSYQVKLEVLFPCTY